MVRRVWASRAIGQLQASKLGFSEEIWALVPTHSNQKNAQNYVQEMIHLGTSTTNTQGSLPFLTDGVIYSANIVCEKGCDWLNLNLKSLGPMSEGGRGYRTCPKHSRSWEIVFPTSPALSLVLLNYLSFLCLNSLPSFVPLHKPLLPARMSLSLVSVHSPVKATSSWKPSITLPGSSPFTLLS